MAEVIGGGAGVGKKLFYVPMVACGILVAFVFVLILLNCFFPFLRLKEKGGGR